MIPLDGVENNVLFIQVDSGPYQDPGFAEGTSGWISALTPHTPFLSQMLLGNKNTHNTTMSDNLGQCLAASNRKSQSNAGLINITVYFLLM